MIEKLIKLRLGHLMSDEKTIIMTAAESQMLEIVDKINEIIDILQPSEDKEV